MEFQSSRSLRTATGGVSSRARQETEISILAVLADRDSETGSNFNDTVMYFNPRGPCGPRPAAPLTAPTDGSYFNPRGPCGPRPPRRGGPSPCRYFNPRGPCGPRPPASPSGGPRRRFQSSRSLRTATGPERHQHGHHAISILAVLADRDAGLPHVGVQGSLISILAVLADRD